MAMQWVWMRTEASPSWVVEAQRPATARFGIRAFRHMPSGMWRELGPGAQVLHELEHPVGLGGVGPHRGAIHITVMVAMV
jgi:hypothetical protein